LYVVCSTPKNYIPVPASSAVSDTFDSHQPVVQLQEPTDASTEPSVSQTSTTSGLISYHFISDPLKKAFFESSAPAAGTQQVILNKSDIDINLEAKINQYVAHCAHY